MTIIQIRQVVEIANCKSISKAAEKLFISQPNLSSSIRHLEEEVGISIFKRTNQGTELTRYGQQFVSRCRSVLSEVSELEQLSESFKVEVPLELKVGSIGLRFVNEAAAYVCNRFSGNPINVSVGEQNIGDIIRGVSSGRLELGFIVAYDFSKKILVRNAKLLGCDYYKIADAVAGIYVSPDTEIFKDCECVPLDKLSQSVMVNYMDTNPEVKMYVGNIFNYIENVSGNIVHISRTVNVGNPGLMRYYVNCLDGFSTAAYCREIYDNSGFFDSIKFLPFEEGLIKCEVGLVQRHNTPRSVLADELMKHIDAMIGE